MRRSIQTRTPCAPLSVMNARRWRARAWQGARGDWRRNRRAGRGPDPSGSRAGDEWNGDIEQGTEAQEEGGKTEGARFARGPRSVVNCLKSECPLDCRDAAGERAFGVRLGAKTALSISKTGQNTPTKTPAVRRMSRPVPIVRKLAAERADDARCLCQVRWAFACDGGRHNGVGAGPSSTKLEILNPKGKQTRRRCRPRITKRSHGRWRFKLQIRNPESERGTERRRWRPRITKRSHGRSGAEFDAGVSLKLEPWERQAEAGTTGKSG